MNMTSTDRIEKKVVLRAARSRVWRAIASAQEFGTWFGAKLEGINYFADTLLFAGTILALASASRGSALAGARSNDVRSPRDDGQAHE